MKRLAAPTVARNPLSCRLDLEVLLPGNTNERPGTDTIGVTD